MIYKGSIPDLIRREKEREIEGIDLSSNGTPRTDIFDN